MDIEKNPNPTKDQHFLVDKDIIQKIVDIANIQDGEYVIEIGGGSGAITDLLVQRNIFLTVIEKDPYFANYLKQKYSSFKNVTVIEGDALDFDYSGCDRIISNLPFTITEPLFINLSKSGVLNSKSLKSMSFIMSQNSTRKIVAPIQTTEGGSKHFNQEFGIMSAISKTFLDTDIISTVPSDCFYPEPAVTSFIVNFTPKKKKTTVDRIMTEFLSDSKNRDATIKRIYQLMLARGEIYKTNKHKNNTTNISTSFTSQIIENKNIYELNHSQLSQLLQDLIKNDMRIKSQNSQRNNQRREPSLRDYLYMDNYDFDDEEDEEEYIPKQKHLQTYDYMYDSIVYNALLNRGLEDLSQEELNELLGKEKEFILKI